MGVQYCTRLLPLRRAASLTQLAVAERAGFPRGRLSRLETGVLTEATAETRRGLAKAFGLPLEILDAYLEGGLGLAETIAQRAHEPPAVQRPYACRPAANGRFDLDLNETDGDSDLDLRIEERFRRERTERGAHTPLGEWDEDAIYLQGGE